jgi:hypothetical protein
VARKVLKHGACQRKIVIVGIFSSPYRSTITKFIKTNRAVNLKPMSSIAKSLATAERKVLEYGRTLPSSTASDVEHESWGKEFVKKLVSNMSMFSRFLVH